jgi:hypothetical protein
MVNQGTRVVTAVLAATIAAGCSPQNKSSSGLAVSTHSAAAADASPAGLTLPNGIEITEIRMAVRRVFVDGDDAENACSTATSTPPPMMAGTASWDPFFGWSGAPSGGDDGEDHHRHDGPERGDDGKCDFAFGPFDVDLAGSALSGSVAFAFDVPVPPGTYEEVGIDIGMVSTTAAGDNAVLQELAGVEHASIVVDGLVQVDASTTQQFSFQTPMHVRQKREGKIAIGNGSNVTLDFDPTGWFTGPGGVRLDPRDPTARGEILENIRASIRFISDDDHDGIDDAEEHHSGGGGGEGSGGGTGMGRGD